MKRCLAILSVLFIMLASACDNSSIENEAEGNQANAEEVDQVEEVRGRDKTATYITKEELEERRKEKDREFNNEHGIDNISSSNNQSKQAPTIGMTDYEAIESTWGKPTKINKTESINGIREQWVYDRGYLYFEDHYLTSIQSSR